MSPSPKITLYIRAEDGGAVEIAVQDSAFRTVDRGVGFLQPELDPGIYTVVANAGGKTWKQMVVLDPGKTQVELTVLPMEFASPVPLQSTSQSHEYHQIAAENQSRRVHAQVGTGSAIFVTVREFTGKGAAAKPTFQGNPLAGLTLHSAAGKELVDLQAAGAADKAGSWEDAWGCCNIVLDPGFYRLRQQLISGDSVDLGLVASRGWQTQVFALLGTYGGENPELQPDLVESSILMTRFDPSRPEEDRGGYSEFGEQYQRGNRLAELARLGLSNRREVLKREMYEMLYQKFDNPMLGILGAHLLLAKKAIDLDLLKTVVGNLRNLLGEHPDVEALALALPDEPVEYTFPFPPMVRRGWSMVVKASWDHPKLVPKDSLSYLVATCLWGEDPWNLWRVRAEEEIAKPYPVFSMPGPARPSFSSYEKAVIHQVASSTAEIEQVGGGPGSDEIYPAGLSDTSPEQLAESLCLPRANVEDLLDNLKMNASFYEVSRSRMLPGKKRTTELEKIVSRFRVTGLRSPSESAGLVAQLVEDNSPGNRVAALALLQVNPDASYFPFILKTIVSSKSAFEQYHGLVAARDALPYLTDAQKLELRAAVEGQRNRIIPKFKEGSDRWGVSEMILKDLDKPASSGR